MRIVESTQPHPSLLQAKWTSSANFQSWSRQWCSNDTIYLLLLTYVFYLIYLSTYLNFIYYLFYYLFIYSTCVCVCVILSCFDFSCLFQKLWRSKVTNFIRLEKWFPLQGEQAHCLKLFCMYDKRFEISKTK